jgi:serine/threonine protein phosphatase PrpC
VAEKYMHLKIKMAIL